MTGVIAAVPPFAPLADPDVFARVEVVGQGTGVGWPGELDFSATALAELAREQRPMTGAEFADWIGTFNISVLETARLFGVSVSTVKTYRKTPEIPVAWQIACNAMRDNPTLFHARFRPSRPGRPPGAGTTPRPKAGAKAG